MKAMGFLAVGPGLPSLLSTMGPVLQGPELSPSEVEGTQQHSGINHRAAFAYPKDHQQRCGCTFGPLFPKSPGVVRAGQGSPSSTKTTCTKGELSTNSGSLIIPIGSNLQKAASLAQRQHTNPNSISPAHNGSRILRSEVSGELTGRLCHPSVLQHVPTSCSKCL